MSPLLSPSSRRSRATFTLPALLACLVTSAPVIATPIYPDEMHVADPDKLPLEEKRRYTMALMQISPLPTDKPITIWELSDPLGIDRATLPRLFGRKIHFPDLLATADLGEEAGEELELPPGALKGIDILQDLDALLLSYDGRAWDRSVLDIKNTERIEKRGRPVTINASPLTLKGFGEIVRSPGMSASSAVETNKDKPKKAP